MQLQQRDKELAAIGASIGCNCRPRVEHHIPAGNHVLQKPRCSAPEVSHAIYRPRP